MDFELELERAGITALLNYVDYKEPDFFNFDKVMSYLNSITSEDRVYLIGDYDVDGLMCVKIMDECLNKMGVDSRTVFHYKKRTHQLDKFAVIDCVQGKYTHCIVMDCGSQNIDLLKTLVSFGVKVLLLDHHNTPYDYDFYESIGVLAINTMIEKESYDLSAGGLCFCVAKKALDSRGISSDYLAAYGLTSLLSDCMSMKSELNRSIYYIANSLDDGDIPKCLLFCMNQYSRFNSRYITFWFAPRVNSLFRAGKLDIINRFFFDGDDNAIIAAQIENIYETSREMVTKIADIIQITQLDNFVYADIGSVSDNFDVEKLSLWEYTGLIANKLSDRYSQPALVFCEYGSNVKASVRDIYGRNYLTPLSSICKAQGHDPAFGITMSSYELDRFLADFERLCKKFMIEEPANKPIILKYPYATPDVALIEKLAVYNEFASPHVPVALIQKQRIGDMKETKTKYDYRYTWGDYKIHSDYAKSFGTWMTLRPMKSYKTKLVVV